MKEKLIDILVDHLDEWPFDGGQITQDSDGFCFWTKADRKYLTGENGSWVLKEDCESDCFWRLLVCLPPASDWNVAIITEEMWNKAKNLSQSSPPYEVGEIIEHECDWGVWQDVRVLGWGKHGGDDCIMFCELSKGKDSKLHAWMYTGFERCFREKNPSKTKLIREVVKVLGNCDTPDLTMIANSLYDNGLLKKEED